MTLEEHKNLGIKYFNSTWDLIDKDIRTKEEDARMIHYAHASRLHWDLSGAEVLNIVRGDWQISRVYSILGMGESAMYHAKLCHDKTIQNHIGDFDLVFAYECMASAFKILGDSLHMNEYLMLGYRAIDHVKDLEDQKYCKRELDNIKK